MALWPRSEARRHFSFLEDGMQVTRRELIKATSTAALLAGVPGGWAGGVYAADGPEAPKVRIGIIALTDRSEEHTSELQSRQYLVCRLLLEKKKIQQTLHRNTRH